MNILAIDTATESCSACVLSERGADTVFESQSKVDATGHSKRVLAMVDECLDKSNLKLTDIDYIAVDIGPGSFTGLRIGIGVAQGLAYGCCKKVIGVGSLETLAIAHFQQSPTSDYVLAAIDARMNQVYWAIYSRNKASDFSVVIPPTVSDPLDIDLNLIADNTCIGGIGSGWDTYETELKKRLLHFFPEQVSLKISNSKYPQANDVALLARKNINNAIDPQLLIAEYVRNNVVN